MGDTHAEAHRRTRRARALVAPVALAQSTYPEKIALPDGFAPEGIEIALGHTFYVGSVQTGAIYVGDLRTGARDPLVDGATTPGTRGATGIEYDHGRLWVAGAGHGTARVYDARTGALLEEYQLATPPGTFINDVVVTNTAAYFTDSQRPVLYRIALSRNGIPGALTTIPLGGDYQHVAGQFNLNGIVATPNGKTLIAVQSVARKLLVIDAGTGVATTIDIGGYDLANGDGLLLQGKTLYVVQNRLNKVAVFELSEDLASATFVRAISDADFDVPTTIDRAGERLYVVNARFGTTTPTDQSYHVVKAG
ncbi:MAG: superoxide dismutase [Actinobacteria bacterium]|nr:superoxide dismutase [Actinomycetota bacterium]